MSRQHRTRGIAAALAMLLAAAAVPAATSGSVEAAPSSNGCNNRQLNQINKLLDCVDADDAFVHLQALQDIADANGGTRASGTPGYDQSADYVAGLLEDAGYDVERQVFDFSLFTENSSSLTVDGTPIDTQTMSFSGSADIEGGNVIPVDLDLGLDNTSTSGCTADDFVGPDWSGMDDIALIQRGACAFGLKAVNAQAAGAEAVIIFNQGNTADPGRQGIIGGTLGADVVGTLTIPVLDTSYSDGLVVLNGTTVDLAADTTIVTNSTENIIADLPGKNPDNVVMAGAHLDSVGAGPGIQDNGSGSAALLAIALQLGNNTKYTPENTLRFAWWGAEESGLIGSDNYIFNPEFGLTDEEYFALALYLNFDMVASPNFIYGVYDADESTFEASAPVPPGSDVLEDLFEAFYTIEGIPYEDTEFSGRSDYQAFIDVGIPASGLFTGAEQVKTPEQASIWGGTAGDQYDPCYHLACDTIDNVSREAMEVNIDAIAYAIYNVASTTEAVNGVAGVEPKGTTPSEVTFDGPQGTFLGGGGMSAGDTITS
jgi:Zn-dependent M28 family amino/carboxypeptidase